VHILARHGRTITQADWVKEVKRVTITGSGNVVATIRTSNGRPVMHPSP
jgi:hypothetical protein